MTAGEANSNSAKTNRDTMVKSAKVSTTNTSVSTSATGIPPLTTDISSKRTVLGSLVKVVAVISLLGAVAAQRYLSQGPYTPWTCSVFGYKCERRYDVPFHGYVHDDYSSAEQAFKDNFFAGEDVGAAVAAYVKGELVMDMQGGWQNVKERTPYSNESLQLVFSSTKVFTSIVVAQFVGKGVISYDEKIATYWPEFAQGNKENVTLGDLMVHAGGVGFIDVPITSAEAEDPERFSRILAAQPHNFGGVRTRSYHASTYGWYVNEILKRTANCTVDDVAAEFNKDYDIEWYLKPYQLKFDNRISPFYTSTPLYRFSRLIKFVGGPVKFLRLLFEKNDAKAKTFKLPLEGTPALLEYNLQLRRIEAPAYSGFTNARSIAKLAAMMANDGKAIMDGEPDLLTREGYAVATKPAPVAFDMIIQRSMPQERGGWGKFDDFVIGGVEFTGWAGMGGSVFMWNSEHKIGFGYCMNGIPDPSSPDDRSISILRALVKQVLKKK
ncbi:beta-lactamase/transpeptidase-like protein [Zychaea mexicana]|uniref:beta-lactamase/transpeptidase-like protein n=1 Tax=Zychaea mexicana TaxID=64656 RepID=UPI0022FE30AC|nr:beta-lactamase/transpeptidase-like protein [Zychaea mexicana]KAI9489751.1 beta-lactamase/transpeptidase-like protein [Zychaea mexicana]